MLTIQRYAPIPEEIDAIRLPDGRYLILADPPRYADADAFEAAFQPIGTALAAVQILEPPTNGNGPGNGPPKVLLSERPLPPDDGLDVDERTRRSRATRRPLNHAYDVGKDTNVDQAAIEEVVQAAKGPKRSAWRVCPKCDHAAHAKSKCDHCGAAAPKPKKAAHA